MAEAPPGLSGSLPVVLTEGGVMGLAGADGSGDGARWRVFISHTSELRGVSARRSRTWPRWSEAISAAGHVIVDMADFPAADQACRAAVYRPGAGM